MKHLQLFLLTFLFITPNFATIINDSIAITPIDSTATLQNNNTATSQNDSSRTTITIKTVETKDVVDEIPEVYVQQIDKFYNEWMQQKSKQTNFVDSTHIKELKLNTISATDDTYKERIRAMVSGIPLSYNSIVRSYIDMYLTKRTLQVATMLGTAEYYFPIFEEALDAENMPLEIKYLAIVESALNPCAMSRVGASGLWQFMYNTGKMMGLEISTYVDQRRDPVLSSRAAARYLKDLHGIYDDWILALAAYNCGPGNVNKAIRRSGGKRNYWDIYYNLPRETRGYVPAFIAAAYVFTYHEKHNIYPIKSKLPEHRDTVMVNDLLHLNQVAATLKIDPSYLQEMNPQYKNAIIPATLHKSYPLVLPAQNISEFINKQDDVFAHNRTKYFDDTHRDAEPSERIIGGQPQNDHSGNTRIVYSVKNGDVPGVIAERFNVRTSDIRYWNNLNSRLTIRVGQKLVLYVKPAIAQKYKNGTINKSSNTTQKPSIKPTPITGDFTYYTIKSGDNLWDIAKKYPGISNTDIMKWNGLTDKDVKSLKPGDKLKIKV